MLCMNFLGGDGGVSKKELLSFEARKEECILCFPFRFGEFNIRESLYLWLLIPDLQKHFLWRIHRKVCLVFALSISFNCSLIKEFNTCLKNEDTIEKKYSEDFTFELTQGHLWLLHLPCPSVVIGPTINRKRENGFSREDFGNAI